MRPSDDSDGDDGPGSQISTLQRKANQKQTLTRDYFTATRAVIAIESMNRESCTQHMLCGTFGEELDRVVCWDDYQGWPLASVPLSAGWNWPSACSEGQSGLAFGWFTPTFGGMGGERPSS